MSTTAFISVAEKHLTDSSLLLAQKRFDNAGYLSGYVVECCLKALLDIDGMPSVKELGHGLRNRPCRRWDPDFHDYGPKTVFRGPDTRLRPRIGRVVAAIYLLIAVSGRFRPHSCGGWLLFEREESFEVIAHAYQSPFERNFRVAS